MRPTRRSVRRRSPILRRYPVWLERLVSVGVVSRDPEVRRRQVFVNIGVFAILFNNAFHTLFNALYDFQGLLPLNIYNVALTVLVLLTPLLHRSGDIAGALYLIALTLFGNFYVVMALGLAGGALAYYTLAGAAFVLFGVRQWRVYVILLVGAFAIILGATAFVSNEGFLLPGDTEFRRNFAGQILLNVLVLNTVMVVYALWALRRAETALAREHQRAQSLVDRALPASVGERLKAQPDRRIADAYDALCVLVAQIDGFSAAFADLPPRKAIDFLDTVHSDFDRLCDRYAVDKIRAGGDRYVVVGGLQGDPKLGAVAIGGLALEMMETAAGRAEFDGRAVGLRIGIHCGSAIAGIVGRSRLSFDLWGDAPDGALALPALSETGRILVSGAFVQATSHVFEFAGHRPLEEVLPAISSVAYLTGMSTPETP